LHEDFLSKNKLILLFSRFFVPLYLSSSWRRGVVEVGGGVGCVVTVGIVFMVVVVVVVRCCDSG